MRKTAHLGYCLFGTKCFPSQLCFQASRRCTAVGTQRESLSCLYMNPRSKALGLHCRMGLQRTHSVLAHTIAASSCLWSHSQKAGLVKGYTRSGCHHLIGHKVLPLPGEYMSWPRPSNPCSIWSSWSLEDRGLCKVLLQRAGALWWFFYPRKWATAPLVKAIRFCQH